MLAWRVRQSVYPPWSDEETREGRRGHYQAIAKHWQRRMLRQDWMPPQDLVKDMTLANAMELWRENQRLKSKAKSYLAEDRAVELEDMKLAMRADGYTARIREIEGENQQLTVQVEDLSARVHTLNLEKQQLTIQVDSFRAQISGIEARGRVALEQWHGMLRTQAVCDVAGSMSVFVRLRGSPVSDPRPSAELLISGRDRIILGHGKDQEDFRFTGVFLGNLTELTRALEPQVVSVMRGHDVSIIADGQSGSGKTTAMFSTTTGVVPTAARQLLDFLDHLRAFDDKASSYTITYCFVEFANNTARDLLSGRRDLMCGAGGLSGQELLRLGDTAEFNEKLGLALRNRGTASSTDNASSSRSDMLCRFVLAADELRDGRRRQTALNLVDLAGNERAAPNLEVTDVDAEQRTAERCQINLGRESFQRLCSQWNRTGQSFRENKVGFTTAPELTPFHRLHH